MIHLLMFIAWATRNRLHIAIAGKRGLVLVAGDAVRKPIITPTGIHFRYVGDCSDLGNAGCILTTGKAVL